jgi:large subunit ribosomal protein L10
MRPEKKFLVEEVASHLRKSDYVFLANFNRITVSDVATLRSRLSAEQAEFHVVKNTSLRVAARDLSLPDLENMLSGPTAIVVGGQNPSGVAKILQRFFDETTKLEVKGGVLSQRRLAAGDVGALAQLPSLDVLRGQLLSLLNTPATTMVRVLNAAPESLLNVLQAKIAAAEAAP